MYGWTIVVIFDLMSLGLFFKNPDATQDTLAFKPSSLIASLFMIDCVILCVCTALCWLFSTWRHWRQERRLNFEARRFVELTQKILTHPKNTDEEYLAKLFQDFRKG